MGVKLGNYFYAKDNRSITVFCRNFIRSKLFN